MIITKEDSVLHKFWLSAFAQEACGCPLCRPRDCPRSCSGTGLLSNASLVLQCVCRSRYSLGVFDGSIQGAEEGTAFLHHTMEMHLVKEVALCVAEILGTKPGQSRQAGVLGKAPKDTWCRNRPISLAFQPYYHSVY